MRNGETTIEDLAEGVRQDSGYEWAWKGALLYAVGGGGGGGGGAGTFEDVVAGRVLPSLRSPHPVPGVVSRLLRIREGWMEANRTALDYHLGRSASDSAHIRGWLRALLSDAAVGKEVCSAAGIGATCVVEGAGEGAVWKNSWFSWMGEAKADQRLRRSRLNAFLKLEIATSYTGVGSKRLKVRSFQIAGFNGVTCGVVERAVLTNACAAD
jgi:hypothetical protein